MYFFPPTSPCGRFGNGDGRVAPSLHHDDNGLTMSPTRGGFLGGDMSIEWGAHHGEGRNFCSFSQGQFGKETLHFQGEWWGENDVTTCITLDGPPPASLATDTFRSQKRRQGGPVVAGRIIKEDSTHVKSSTSPIPSPVEDAEIEMMTCHSDGYDESSQGTQPRRKKVRTETVSTPPPPLPPVRKSENHKRAGRRSAEILPPVAPPLPIALQLSPPMPVLRAPKRKAVSAPFVAFTPATLVPATYATSDTPGAIVSSSPPWAPAPTSPPFQASSHPCSSTIRSPCIGNADRPSDVQLNLSPRSFENFRIQAETYQKMWEDHMIASKPFHEREAKSQQHRAASPSRNLLVQH